MSSQFPPRGRFDESPLHELIVRLIRGRFSGSVEVRSEAAVRIFHFDNGHLCAATSDHPVEQLDVILEKTISPTLSREQRKLARERRQAGQPLARALVDLGVVHATELLAYNRNLAENILRGALADSPEEYRLNVGRPGQYNPVPFDPLVVVRDSILDNLDEENIARRLGDNTAVFVATGKMDSEKGALAGDPELGLTVSNLDGRKSIGELAGRLGMNPDRTRRLLYFLSLVGWISHTSDSNDLTQPAAGGLPVGPSALAGAYGVGAKAEDDGAEGLLKLLEEQEEGLYQPEQKSKPAPADDFQRSLDQQLGVSHERDSLLEKNEKVKGDAPRPSAFFNLLGKIWLPVVAALLVTLGFLIVFTSMPPSGNGEKISFYQDDLDTTQLALDEEFTDSHEAGSPAIELQLSQPDESAQIDDAQPQAAEETQQPPTREESTPTQEERTPPQEPETQPVETATSRNYPDFASAQDNALRAGHSGRWHEASSIWRAALNSEADKRYTLLIQSVEKSLFIADIFEKFANSAQLRDKFFILRADKESENYLVCWGLFADAEEARAAAAALPARITAYRPVPYDLSDRQ